ncbi:hypothetical protein [Pseudomonas fluorescens]|uniref:hypothetical protein n=1 Tax=Pseudomonas fluorescens TaxID=294 RepID=UPI0012406A48|nr:hypothetical protein [Pseudomonas fluorescens]
MADIEILLLSRRLKSHAYFALSLELCFSRMTQIYKYRVLFLGHQRALRLNLGFEREKGGLKEQVQHLM